MKNATTRRIAMTTCLFLTGLVPAVGAAGTAAAAPPADRFFTEQIDLEVPSAFFTAACGFDAWYTIKGTITTSLHNNEMTIVRYPEWVRTLYGPGGSLSLREAGVDQITTEVTETGFIETIHSSGHFNHSWVVPGYGPVQLEAGTFTVRTTYVWDDATQDYILTDELLHTAGPDDFDLTAADKEALCGYLG